MTGSWVLPEAARCPCGPPRWRCKRMGAAVVEAGLGAVGLVPLDPLPDCSGMRAARRRPDRRAPALPRGKAGMSSGFRLVTRLRRPRPLWSTQVPPFCK